MMNGVRNGGMNEIAKGNPVDKKSPKWAFEKDGISAEELFADRDGITYK